MFNTKVPNQNLDLSRSGSSKVKDGLVAIDSRQTHIESGFWNEVDTQAKSLGLVAEQWVTCVYVACGMTPWDAWAHAAQLEGSSLIATGVDPARLPIQDKKVNADIATNTPAAKVFTAWFLETVAEKYNVDLTRYDWTFKDSEHALRFIIDASTEQITRSRVVTQSTSSAIINAVKELNAMHKHVTKDTSLTGSQTVVFLGEGDLL